MPTYKKQWRALYRHARLTKSINRNMVKDVLSGTIRPSRSLMEMVYSYKVSNMSNII